MKLRSFFTALAIVVTTLFLVGAGGLYWIVSTSPLNVLIQGQGATPIAAMFVPKQAPVVVSLLTNPDRLERFRRVVAQPSERREARAELTQLEQRLLASTGLDYHQDIQPWLGDEITLAVTTPDLDRDRANGQQPGYLLAVATRDTEQAREFLQLFWQKRAISGADLVFEQYKGVKIIYGNVMGAPVAHGTKPAQGSVKPAASPSLATAVVGSQFVLFANDPKVLRNAINNAQAPGLSIGSATFYQRTLDTLDQPRIGLSFVNLPRLAEFLGAAPQTTTKATTTIPEPLYQTVAIALELNRQGITLETALIPTGDKGETVKPALSQPVAALQYLPASSAISAAGNNLDRFWQQVNQGLTGYPTVAQLVNLPIAQLQHQTTLDLPAVIFPLIKGEYALGVVPTPAVVTVEPSKKTKKKPAPPTAAPTPATDWVFVTRRSADTRTLLEKLDAIAQKQGLSSGQLPLDNQTVSAWTRLITNSAGTQLPSTLQAEVRGVHTTVEDYELFASSIAAMNQALSTGEASLLNSSAFQQATRPLLEPNDGYLYLDWHTTAPLLERQFPLLKVVQLAGKPFFSHLRSLTVSSYGSEAGIRRGGILLRLS